ncbi:MAG TPA: dienelactone hydrolase family protein [Chthoniobacterales bacterium]
MKPADEIKIPAGKVTLDGNLSVPESAQGLVLFVHGSGSSRHSPRNRFVAGALNDAGLATLLFDLLTSEEEMVDSFSREHRFDIDLLAARLDFAMEWVLKERSVHDLPIGYFGSSTGAAAALVGAAARPDHVAAVVSRGGRPDLAGNALAIVRPPTLLVVGGNDDVVIGLNRDAMARMRCKVTLKIVPGAGHLFEEPGKLEEVARLAGVWFNEHFTSKAA